MVDNKKASSQSGEMPSAILLVSRSSASNAGGMETVFEKLGDGLEREGWAVHRMYHAEDNQKTSLQARSTATRFAYLQTRKGIPTPAFLSGFVRTLVDLANRLRDIRPDVVNCHYADFYCLYFVILRPVFGYRLVITSHGSDVLMIDRSSMAPIVRFCLRRSDAVIAVARDIADRLIAIGVKELRRHLISNGVDTEFWSSEVSREVSADAKMIVSVGALKPVKGHDVLLDAFAGVAEVEKDCRLVIIGDGPLRSRLEKQVVALGLGGRVTFTGWLSREQVRALYAEADVFVMPSRSEGRPLALMEAMSMGLPVVASDVGGIADVLDGCGILTPSENPDALGSAILSLMQESDRRSHLSALSRTRSRSFSDREVMNAYMAVIRQVMSTEVSRSA